MRVTTLYAIQNISILGSVGSWLESSKFQEYVRLTLAVDFKRALKSLFINLEI